MFYFIYFSLMGLLGIIAMGFICLAYVLYYPIWKITSWKKRDYTQMMG